MCKHKQLSVLVCAEEVESDEEDLTQVAREVEAAITEGDISLSSVVGLTSPKTMKMRGTIGGAQVIIMIDPGATNNFISVRTVEKSCLMRITAALE